MLSDFVPRPLGQLVDRNFPAHVRNGQTILSCLALADVLVRLRCICHRSVESKLLFLWSKKLKSPGSREDLYFYVSLLVQVTCKYCGSTYKQLPQPQSLPQLRPETSTFGRASGGLALRGEQSLPPVVARKKGCPYATCMGECTHPESPEKTASPHGTMYGPVNYVRASCVEINWQWWIALTR